MAATFTSVVLGHPEIASMVFEFQFGVYEDVRPVFHACNELVELEASRRVYAYDPSFRQAFAPNAVWSFDFGTICPTEYALRRDHYDPRLPLHLAVVQGFVQLTKRILGCRPDLASDDAIILAFQKSHLEIAELLLNQRDRVGDQSAIIRANTPAQLVTCMNYWGDMLARDDSKGLLLLQRFGLHPDDVSESGRQYVISRATLENATLALDLFPWLHYPRLLNDMAGRGFLPLVRSLHERGYACSSFAMDQAAASGDLEVVRFLHVHQSEGCTIKAMDMAAAHGHLEVVQFLHFNRTEGCTTKALDGAISHGHLEVVRFLLEHRTEGASPSILDRAAAYGRLEVVQYLHHLGSFDCTVGAVDKAAANGHWETVDFLLTNRSEGCTHDKVVEYALKRCRLRTVEYLLSRGYPFNIADNIGLRYICDDPESVGVFELMVAHGRPVKEDWLPNACFCGNLPLARFLHALADTSMRAEALDRAVGTGAWDIVRFFFANDAMDVSANTLKEALRTCHLEIAAQILQRQPELRDEKLLKAAAAYNNTKAIRFLLDAGIGNPRECLVKIVGRRQRVTTSEYLLPHCMAATDHLDNVVFLLDLLALPDRRRKTTLQLITSELLDQGRKASQTIQLVPSVAARAIALLEAGEVVEWALALVIGHLHATDSAATIEQLEKKTALVQDAELKMQLQRLLEEQA